MHAGFAAIAIAGGAAIRAGPDLVLMSNFLALHHFDGTNHVADIPGGDASVDGVAAKDKEDAFLSGLCGCLSHVLYYLSVSPASIFSVSRFLARARRRFLFQRRRLFYFRVGVSLH